MNLNLKVTVLSRDPENFLLRNPSFKTPEYQFIQGDVRTFDLSNEPFQLVIHGAAPASAKFNQENPEAMKEIIVEGTRRVLEQAQKSACEKFLLISSGAVYGNSVHSHIPENNPLQPESDTNAYAEGKRLAEELCQQSPVCVKIARCFAFVGPHLPLDTHFAIGNFIGDVLKNKNIQILGDGQDRRSYLYAADLVIWLLRILDQGQPGEAYNVGSELSISIRELAREVLRVGGSHQPSPIPTLEPRGPIRNYVPNTRKAHQELGLSQLVPLHEALSKTIMWHKS